MDITKCGNFNFTPILS